jgi:hypothetical protein
MPILNADGTYKKEEKKEIKKEIENEKIENKKEDKKDANTKAFKFGKRK